MAHKEGGNIAAQVVTKCGRVLGGSNTFSAYVNLQEAEKCNQNKWGLGRECWEAHQRGMGNTLSISGFERDYSAAHSK